jgi:predicted transcriptional regulator
MKATQWLEAEELYKQGWTQKEIAKRYGIRPETVSVHMAKDGVKGGSQIDVVRQEMSEALNRKLKDFAERRAYRQIDTKEKFHTLINTLLAFYVKELKDAQTKGATLDKISGSARALKESLTGLKMAREELYAILEIKPDQDVENTPELFVMSMSVEEEERIRASGGYRSDDELDDAPDLDVDVDLMADIRDLRAATDEED